jgi:hypothetical protein
MAATGFGVAQGTITGAILNGAVVLLNATPFDLTGGQIKFPATQNASADANTMDDYEEGFWTPVLTFLTPGNLSVVYASGGQDGSYTKIGRLINLFFTISTTTFTHTTASGNLSITGLPFNPATLAGGNGMSGATSWQGITKAGYTDMIFIPTSAGIISFISGSGVTSIQVSAADMPTGGTVKFFCCMTYFTN